MGVEDPGLVDLTHHLFFCLTAAMPLVRAGPEGGGRRGWPGPISARSSDPCRGTSPESRALAGGRRGRYDSRAMLSDERIEAYRMMSQEERWREVEELMTFAWRFLKQLPHEEVERRLAFDRKQHDESDEIVLAHLRRFP